jgi:hypothetical protein
MALAFLLCFRCCTCTTLWLLFHNAHIPSISEGDTVVMSAYSSGLLAAEACSFEKCAGILYSQTVGSDEGHWGHLIGTFEHGDLLFDCEDFLNEN